MNKIKKSPLSKVNKRNLKKKQWNINRNPKRRINWMSNNKVPIKMDMNDTNFSRFPNMGMDNSRRHENYVQHQLSLFPNGLARRSVYGSQNNGYGSRKNEHRRNSYCDHDVVQGRSVYGNNNGLYGDHKFGQRTNSGRFQRGHIVGQRPGRCKKIFSGDPQACLHEPLHFGFRHSGCQAAQSFGFHKNKVSLGTSPCPRQQFPPPVHARPRPRSRNARRNPQRRPPHQRNEALSKQLMSPMQHTPSRDGEVDLDQHDVSPLRAPPAPHNTTSFILHHKWLSEMCLDMTPPTSPHSTTTTQKDENRSIIDYNASVFETIRQERLEKQLREAEGNKIDHNKNVPNVINEDEQSRDEEEDDEMEDHNDEHEDDIESVGDNINQDLEDNWSTI